MDVKERATRKRILDIAEELILTRGYNGFSYQDISKSIGIRKASIHYHYPLKEDLVERYTRKQVVLFKMWCKTIGKHTSTEKLYLFGRMYLTLSKQGRKICPIGMLTAEFPVLPAKIQARVRELLESELSWLEGVIADGVAAGEINRQINIHRTALIILTTLAGMLKMFRIHKDPAEAEGMINELIKLLEVNNDKGEERHD
jgi:TetR/AcrR family transcriptional repressor of nem operon